MRKSPTPSARRGLVVGLVDPTTLLGRDVRAIPLPVLRRNVAAVPQETFLFADTIAENRKTIGMSGVDHHGFAFTDPKMNPT